MTRPSSARLDMIDAVVAGLGSTLGAGVFVGLAAAAALAGGWLWVGVLLVGPLALGSAWLATDLSRACPGADSAYGYARHYFGRRSGRMAGGVHITGRIATLAALAGCFGAYVLPARPAVAAIGVLVVATITEAVGARLSRIATSVLVAIVLLVLAVVLAVCLAIPPPPLIGVSRPADAGGAHGLGGMLAATGVMFFAVLGFDRLAVTDDGSVPPTGPRRLAAPIVLAVALAGYLSVGAVVLRQLGPDRLAWSPAPLRDAVVAADAAPLAPLVIFGVIAATVGVLLPVLARTTRTLTAMSLVGDLPVAGAAVPAALCVGAGGVVAVLVLSPVAAIELAATCALVDCAVTHAARLARRAKRGAERPWPARAAGVGLGLCLLIIPAMPPADLVVTGCALVAGLVLSPLATRLRLIVRR